MKNKYLFLMAILFAALALFGCRRTGSPLVENFDRDASYAIGMDIGMMMAQSGIVPNLDEFLAGVKDVLAGNETRFNQFEASMIIQAAFSELMERMEAEAMQRGAEALQEGIEFLEENSRRPGVITTPSGLQYEVIVEGTGPRPTANDFVRVHYEGTFIDGTVFDSSFARGIPAEFPLAGVIAGWTEGVQLMTVGSTYRFFIPYDLAYGSRGQPPTIPPYATLIFDVELLDIIDMSEMGFGW